MDIKLPFGLKNGQLVEISQVERGLNCGCFCPSCHKPLIARKGEKSIHHFAHHKSQECYKALETSLHLAAKEILEKQKKIRLPAVITKMCEAHGDQLQLFKEQAITFDKIYLEKRLDNIIPDVIIELNGRKLLVEIAVTHFLDEEKKKKIRNLGYSTIEIQLNELREELNLANLHNMLIHDEKNKFWIYNAKEHSFLNEIRYYGKTLKIIKRKFHLHVDYCPLKLRWWKRKPYAYFIDDCVYCNYFFDSIGTKTQSHTHVICVGHAKKEIDHIIKRYNASFI